MAEVSKKNNVMEDIRVEGFYWVRTNSRWRIAEWEWGYWTLTGANEHTYNDSNFLEIGERIIPPNQ